MAVKLKASCRTYNIAQRNVRVGRIVASAYFFISVVRYYRPFHLMSHVLIINEHSSYGSLLYTTDKVSQTAPAIAMDHLTTH
jgi:hypothetical protein